MRDRLGGTAVAVCTPVASRIVVTRILVTNRSLASSGHTWPSGWSFTKRAGVASRDFGNEVLLDFFDAHRVEAGGGAIRVGDRWRGTATGSLAALFPLGRHVLAGPWLRTEPRESALDVDAAIGLRAPILAGAGALQLIVIGGWTAIGTGTWNAAARAGAWVALNPSWALHLEAGAGAHDHTPEVFVTFGVTRLIRFR